MAFYMRVVLRDRIDQVRRNGAARNHVGLGSAGLCDASRIEKQSALLGVPTVVTAGDNAIHLLDITLSDVADVQVATLSIEGQPERIAEPVRKNLLQRACASNERVVGWNAVGSVSGV